MADIQFYILDLETNGLKVDYHEVTEVGIIRVGDTPKNSLSYFKKVKCNFPERSSLDSLKITNKTLNDLKYGSSKSDIVSECDKYFKLDNLTPNHRCIVAHNAAFDRRFCHALWASEGKEFPATMWLDTMAMTKQALKRENIKYASVRLENALKLFEIDKVGTSHNAKSDTQNTYFLFKKLLDKNVDYLSLIKMFPHKVGSEFNIDFSNEDLEPND